MLTYILALAVGLGSLALYIVAFFFPEVHRKNDFIWSGVGLFYALVLWFCAGRITGAVLLGQVASVALLGWFTSESLMLRRQVTPVVEQTKISTEKSTEDYTQKKSKIVSETTSISEVENMEKLDLSDSPITSTKQSENITTEELVNIVKTGETESELLSSETTSDLSKIIKESEAETTESMTEENVLTDAKTELDTSQKLDNSLSKKARGFAQLLTPMSGILSNIKNVIQGRDNKNTDSDSISTQNQADTEKLTSIEEVNTEVNETISQTEDTQAKQESLIEKEESIVSDVKTDKTTLTEVEKEANSSSKLESTPTEKPAMETSKLAEVSALEDSSSSPEIITTQDSQNQEENLTAISSEEKNETDNSTSDLSKDSQNKSVD
ncbi:MAG: hypothetical protein MK289_13155 [Trichodesmium sp. ALOHA_ZT_67]|nr:hypothetical protein [Trichodesmium sp. ALOHA_ZT_67]